jgi:hypothetical protein
LLARACWFESGLGHHPKLRQGLALNPDDATKQKIEAALKELDQQSAAGPGSAADAAATPAN